MQPIQEPSWSRRPPVSVSPNEIGPRWDGCWCCPHCGQQTFWQGRAPSACPRCAGQVQPARPRLRLEPGRVTGNRQGLLLLRDALERVLAGESSAGLLVERGGVWECLGVELR